MLFIDKVIESIAKKNSVLVVGLDPDLDLFPSFILKNALTNKEKADSIYQLNRIIIDSINQSILAVKPQLAYYEVFGSAGISALEKTIAYAKSKGLFVINDAKRGDIGSTCVAYAKAHLGNSPISSDAVTVNPYLGKDGITPFIDQAKKNDNGLFVLVKTSNPSSVDLQDLTTKDDKLIYIKIAELVKSLDDMGGKYGYSSIGAVVGATFPKEAIEVRKILNKNFFLIPGYGMQGAKGRDLINYFDDNGLGGFVSSSRAITYPYLVKQNINKDSIDVETYISLVKEAVDTANKDINQYRKPTILKNI